MAGCSASGQTGSVKLVNSACLNHNKCLTISYTMERCVFSMCVCIQQPNVQLLFLLVIWTWKLMHVTWTVLHEKKAVKLGNSYSYILAVEILLSCAEWWYYHCG